MAEERVTETTDAQGNVIERKFERDIGSGSVVVNTAPERSGGGSGVLMAIVALALIAAVAYFVIEASGAERQKDAAIAEAAEDVGAAAEKAGNAVEQAADKVGEAAKDIAQ